MRIRNGCQGEYGAWDGTVMTRYGTEDLLAAFRQARAASRLTQRQVAARAGVTQSHVSQIERGMLEPGLGTAVQVARAIDHELVLVPRTLVPAIRALARGDDAETLAERSLYALRDDEDDDA